MIAIMGKSPGRANAMLVEVRNLDLSIKRSLQIDMTNGCQFIVPLVDWCPAAAPSTRRVPGQASVRVLMNCLHKVDQLSAANQCWPVWLK
jgi:hypothetical protein